MQFHQSPSSISSEIVFKTTHFSQTVVLKKRLGDRKQNRLMIYLFMLFRLNGSLSAHPEKDELILFGGEFFNGKKVAD